MMSLETPLETDMILCQMICYLCGYSDFTVFRNGADPFDFTPCPDCGDALQMNGGVLATEN